MRHNFTRQTPPTAEEIQAREQWLSEQRAESDRINAGFMLAGQQQREAEFQSRLVEATQLSLEQLGGIREWLKHNP
jgi:hypothetical protein